MQLSLFKPDNKFKIHPLESKVHELKKMWPYIEVSNFHKGGYLIISVGLREMGGQGRIFLQNDLEECFNYVKQLKNKNPNNNE